MLGPAQHREIASVETEIEASTAGAATPPAEQAALRRVRLHSSGRYTAHLGGKLGGAYEVHVLLFEDEAAALAHWRSSHRPEALAATQPVAAGDAAWRQIIGQERGALLSRAALRSGRVVYEIRARGGSARLEAFLIRLGEHARATLGG